MSRLRNRNIRTKINAITRWSEVHTSEKNGNFFESTGVKSTTADSGVVSESLSQKFSQLGRIQTRKHTWEDEEDVELLDSDGDHRRTGFRERSSQQFEGDEDADVSSECSSVDTLKVLDEIRNLEDSVKSMSAESYNSWNEEYEHENTLLVKEEFERMERVLQCRESIPGNYDKDEYRLWIKTFPLLGLVSRTSSLENNKDQQSSPKICDTINLTTPPSAASPSKPWSHIVRTPEDHTTNKTADNHTHYNASILSTNSSTTTTYSSKLLAINNTINPRTANINTHDSFLQLAPLNIAGRRHSFKPSGRNFSNKAQNAQNLMTSTAGHSYTSEWLTAMRFDDLRQYTRSNLYKPTKGVEKHQRRKSSKAEPLKSSSEFIVLPPIEGKELRSSSAATIVGGGGNKMASVVLKHPPVYPLYENDRESDHNDGFVSYRHRKRKYK